MHPVSDYRSFSLGNPADYRALLFIKVLLNGFRVWWLALGLTFHLHPVFRVRTGQSTRIQRRTRCPHDPRRGHGLESGWVKVCMRVFLCVCVRVCVCSETPWWSVFRHTDFLRPNSAHYFESGSDQKAENRVSYFPSSSSVSLICSITSPDAVFKPHGDVMALQWYYGFPLSTLIFKGLKSFPVVCDLMNFLFIIFSSNKYI